MIIKIRFIYIISFVFLKSSLIYCESNTDSLKTIWDTTELPLEKRLDAFIEMIDILCGYNESKNCTSMIQTLKDTVIFHERFDYDLLVDYSFAKMSLWKNPYDVTQGLAVELIECSENIDDYELRADIFNLMSNVYFYKGEHLKSIDIDWSIIEIFDRNGKEHLKGITYYNIAWSYMKVGKILEAYDVLIECGKIADKYNDDFLKNFYLGGMVRLYFFINDNDMTLEYLHRREKVVLKNGYTKAIIEVYLGLAEIGLKTGAPYEKIYEYLDKARNMSIEIKWKLTELKANYQYSLLLISRDSLQKAKIVLSAAEKCAKDLGTEDDLQKIKKELANIYFKQKNYHKPIKLLDNDFRTKGGHETVVDGYGILAESYYALGALDSAYYFSKQKEKYQDSLINENKLTELLRKELNEKYALEKKELQNTQLKQENELLKHKADKQILMLLFVFLSLITMTAVYAAFLLRRKQDIIVIESEKVNVLNRKLEQTNRLLKDSNGKLESFARVVSHDIKSPIHLMGSYLKLIKQNLDKNDKEKLNRYMQYVLQTMGTLESMISNILLLSRLENSEKPKLQAIDLPDVIQKVLNNLSLDIRKADAKIDIKTEGLKPILLNEIHLIQLLQNIISNSLKYRKRNTPVNIHLVCFFREDHLHISIKDNGKGIAKDELIDIYQQFKRLSSSSGVEGNGLGMAITKKIVEIYKGEIKIDSIEGEGTTVHVSLPVTQEQSVHLQSA